MKKNHINLFTPIFSLFLIIYDNGGSVGNFVFRGGGLVEDLEGANRKRNGGKISKIGKKNSTGNGLKSIGNSKKSL